MDILCCMSKIMQLSPASVFITAKTWSPQKLCISTLLSTGLELSSHFSNFTWTVLTNQSPESILKTTQSLTRFQKNIFSIEVILFKVTTRNFSFLLILVLPSDKSGTDTVTVQNSWLHVHWQHLFWKQVTERVEDALR